MVDLADDREAAARQALDEPDLPRRQVEVERPLQERRGEIGQLGMRAGRCDERLPHVVLEVRHGVGP